MKEKIQLNLRMVILLLSFLIIHSTFSIATIRYVSKTGLSIPPYITPETAADSIQKCINVSVFGDTIYVANGVYEEQVVMISGLSLIGAGTDSCEINTQAFAITMSYRSVIVDDTCLFKGFKIVVANNTNLGGGISGSAINSLITENRITKAKYGIVNGSNAKIYKNVIDNISTGMDIFNSNALVRKNTIYTDPNSQAQIIAGIFIQAFNNNYTPLIDSNYIIADGINGILKSIGATPTITNNFIVFTQYGGDAIKLGGSDSANVYNNQILIGTGYGGIYNYSVYQMDIFNNYVVGSPGAYGIFAGPNDTIKNNIVIDSHIGFVPNTTQNLTFQYNNAWNNNVNYNGFTPDNTNLSVDPMIVNDDTTQGELDFHLQMFSPLIDAGDPNILDRDSTRSDIGLYGGPYGESYVYLDLPPRPPVNFTAEVDSGSSFVILTWYRNTEADTAYYNVYRDSTINFTIDPSKLISSQTDTLLLDQIPTGYRRVVYKITAVDQQGNESLPSEEQVINIVGIEREPEVVRNYILYQNYPNPFNPSTKIGYKIIERGYVKLYVYDIKGELVSVLVNQVQEAGYYEVLFDAGYSMLDAGKKTTSNGLASGIYIYQIMITGENNIPVFSDIKKMVFVK